MITSIEIRGLRGIREGRLEPLAPLTMIVGPNGCGKSTVLEAFGVACAGASATAVFQALSSREWLGLAGMKYWVGEGGAEIDATFDPAEKGTTGPWRTKVGPMVPSLGQLSVQNSMLSDPANARGGYADITDDGSISQAGGSGRRLPFALQANFVDRPAGATTRFHGEVRFSSALREALSAIKLSTWYDDWFGYLQELRPNITSIESLAVGERDEPHVFEGKPRVGYPLAYAGDGFRRALLLAGVFARAKGGVAAIDEPEVFAHPAMFAALASLMKRAVADGTQVVFATHSLEFVSTVLRVFEDETDKVALVGLKMEAGALDPVVIAGPDAHRRVVELGHDVRL